MVTQINFATINEEKIIRSLKEKYPWANDEFLEEAITTSAIMINSLILALEKDMHEEALVTYCNDMCEMQQRLADIKYESSSKEREICAHICDQIYDQSIANPCCKTWLKIASVAIRSRQTPV